MPAKVDVYGPGIGDEYIGTSVRRLREQLSTRGLDAQLDTALAAICELQEVLRKERNERDQLARAVHDLEQKLEVDSYDLRTAQTALAALTRGECPSARTYGDHPGPSHDAFRGYYCSNFAHGNPTLDGAARAVTELCAEIHRRQHGDDETVQELHGDLEEAEEQIAGLRAELHRALGDLQNLQNRLAAFMAPKPDPWEHDAAERDSIEHEPVSVWTWLQHPAVSLENA